MEDHSSSSTDCQYRIAIDNKDAVCFSAFNTNKLDCEVIEKIELKQDKDNKLESNLLIKRSHNNLVIDVFSASENLSITAENFYLQEKEKGTELIIDKVDSPLLVIDASTESVEALSDGPEIIYFDGERATLASFNSKEHYTLEHHYVLLGSTPQESSEKDEENTDDHSGLGLGMLGLIGGGSLTAIGGAAALLSQQDDNKKTTTTESITDDGIRQFSGDVVLGPLIEGHGLTVEFYDADNQLLATTAINEDGSYTLDIPSAPPFIKAIVVDTNALPDYMDEATGAPKDLEGSLSAWGIGDSSTHTTTLHINPLTTLAAKLIDDQTVSSTSKDLIASINTALAKTLLNSEEDITHYKIKPIVDHVGSPIGGNAGGSVLSLISALESKHDLNTTQAVESLANALSVGEGQIGMTGQVLQQLNDAQAHLGMLFDSVNVSLFDHIQALAESDNQLPTTKSVQLTSVEDQPLVFSTSAFAFFDQDARDTLQAIRIERLPEKGQLFIQDEVVAQGQLITKDEIPALRYQANANEYGSPYTVFDFSVSDGIGFSETKTVSVAITPVNDVPEADTIALGTMDAKIPTVFAQDALLAEVLDVDGDALTILAVSVPESQGAMLELEGNNWQFTPADDFVGTAEFTMAVSDDQGVAQITATVDVTYTDHAPTIEGDTTAFAEGYLGDELTASGQLIISDANVGESGFIEASASAMGTLHIDQAGAWHYQIDSNLAAVSSLGEEGSMLDTITVHTLDGSAVSIEITIDATTLGDRDAPRIETLGISLSEGDALVLTAQDMLAAKDGISAEHIHWVLTEAQHVTLEGVTVLSEDSYTFTQQQVNDGDVRLHHDGSEAPPSFKAIANIGEASSLPAALTVDSFTLINDAPELTLVNAIAIDEGLAPGTLVATASATDEESNDLRFSLEDSADGRFFIDSNTGEIVVTQSEWLDFEANDAHSLEVKVSDGELSTSQTIDISVNDVNEPAVILGDVSGQATENIAGTTVSGSLSVLDPDPGTSSFVSETLTGHYGTLTIQMNGAWVFTADNATGEIDALSAGEVVEDVFTVSTLGGTTQAIAIQIMGVNDSPELTAEGYTLAAVMPELIANNDKSITVTASHEQNENFQAYMAIDGVQANEIYHYQSWAAAGSSAWWQVDLGAETTIIQYEITGTNRPSRSPKSWELLGSHDGVEFDLIDNQSDQTSWGAFETRLYQLNTDANYQYYRINITDNNGDTHSGFDGFQLLKLVETSEVSVDEDNSITLDVLSNDIDKDHEDTLTLVQADIINHLGEIITNQGVVSIVDNKLVYDTAGDFEVLHQEGSTYVTIRYSLEDKQEEQVESSIMLKVTGVNDAPVFEHFALPIESAESLVLTTAHLNAEDVDSDSLTVFEYTLFDLDHLSLTGAEDLGNGRYSFTQAQLEAGEISITHTGGENDRPSLGVEVTDGISTRTLDNIRVVFNAHNTEPSSVTVDLGATNEDQTFIITQSALLQTSTDANDDKLSIDHLALVDNSTGTITEVSKELWHFTPAANFHGEVIQFRYDIHDHALISHMDFSNGLEAGWSAVNDFQTVASGEHLGTSPSNTPLMQSDAGVGVDGITYTVNTKIGVDHEVTLVVSQSIANATEGLEVLWNNEIIETLTPISANEWRTLTVNLPDTGFDTTELIIREAGETADQSGVRIDSISLHTDHLSTVTNLAELAVLPVDDAPEVQSIDLGQTFEDTPLVFSPTDLLAGVTDVDSNTLAITSLALDDQNEGMINTINSLVFGVDTDNAIASQQTLPALEAFTVAFDFIATGANAQTDTFFSVATPTETESLVVNANRNTGTVEVIINGNAYSFSGLTLADGQLQVFAISWDSTTGSLKLYHNGTFVEEAIVSQGAAIAVDGLAVIGQTQGSYGGDYDATKVLTNAAMHRLSLVSDVMPAEIIGLSQPLSFFTENVELDVQSMNGVLFDGAGKHGLVETGALMKVPSYYVYSPAQDLAKEAITLNFSVTDGTSFVDGHATLDILAVNDAPEVNEVDLGSFDENSTIRFTADALLAGAFDIDSDQLSISHLRLADGAEGVLESPKLIFPDDGTNTIELVEKLPELDAFTVSFDYQSTGTHSEYEHIFSLAVPDEPNALLLGVNASTGEPYFYLNGLTHVFSGIDLYDGELKAIDISWQSDTGVFKFYINDELREEFIFEKGDIIAEGGWVFIGQDQDSYGGGLSASQGLTNSVISRFSMLSEAASTEAIVSDIPLAVSSEATLFDIASDGQVIKDLTGHYSLSTAGSIASSAQAFTYQVPDNATEDQVDFIFTVTDGELHTEQTASLSIIAPVSGKPFALTLSGDEVGMSLIEPRDIGGNVYYWLDVNQDNALNEADRLDYAELSALMNHQAELTFDTETIMLLDEGAVVNLESEVDVPLWVVDQQANDYSLATHDHTQTQGYVLYQVIGG